MANKSQEIKTLDVTFDYLQLTVEDMETWFASGEQDALATARVVCRSLVKYPAHWGNLDDPNNILDNTAYWEWLAVKSQFMDDMKRITELVQINGLVTWDIYKPTTRDIIAYQDANRQADHQQALSILSKFLIQYPEDWGDLQNYDDYKDKLPFWVSKLLFASLNEAMVNTEKK